MLIQLLQVGELNFLPSPPCLSQPSNPTPSPARLPETPEELTCIRELLLKHIRISAPPALAVIIDNLCSSESDDKKKETLLDILEVEGRSWIKKECMEPTSKGEENEDGKLLREGLEQVSSVHDHLSFSSFRVSFLSSFLKARRSPLQFSLAFRSSVPPHPVTSFSKSTAS